MIKIYIWGTSSIRPNGRFLVGNQVTHRSVPQQESSKIKHPTHFCLFSLQKWILGLGEEMQYRVNLMLMEICGKSGNRTRRHRATFFYIVKIFSGCVCAILFLLYSVVKPQQLTPTIYIIKEYSDISLWVGIKIRS